VISSMSITSAVPSQEIALGPMVMALRDWRTAPEARSVKAQRLPPLPYSATLSAQCSCASAGPRLRAPK
jgi:hypothetical protein